MLNVENNPISGKCAIKITSIHFGEHSTVFRFELNAPCANSFVLDVNVPSSCDTNAISDLTKTARSYLSLILTKWQSLVHHS